MGLRFVIAAQRQPSQRQQRGAILHSLRHLALSLSLPPAPLNEKRANALPLYIPFPRLLRDGNSTRNTNEGRALCVYVCICYILQRERMRTLAAPGCILFVPVEILREVCARNN